MSNLHNRAGMSTGTSGQGTMTLSGALGPVAINVASFQSFANSGVVDQEIVQYLILDVNGNWEVGTGTYTASGPTLTRVVKYSNNSNTAISLSGNAQVFINALASDGFDVLGGSTNPMRGFDTPVNLQINATSNGTLLTVAIKGNNGADPSPTNPVYIPFRDSTATGGDPIWRIVTAALNINTNAAGATLGSISNTAFRFWVCAFDNAGTVVLALINCTNPTTFSISPMNEGLVATTTGITGSSTSTGVFYTPNGTALTSKSFRILGYVEYNATGLATAGTYATAPNFIQLFGPGIRKPGEPIQVLVNSTTVSGFTASASFVSLTSGQSIAITPSSAANPIRILTHGSIQNASAANLFLQVQRTSTLIGNPINFSMAVAGEVVPASILVYDLPNTISSTTYSYQGKTSTGTMNYPAPSTGSILEIQELMG